MILLDPAARVVIGHRGNRAHAPENTIVSLGEAVALGVDGVEFDLHASRDGRLVVHHDATLERTTNGAGPVAALTARELQTLDAGYHFSSDRGRTFPWRDRGVRIPTFDDVVDALPRTLPLIIELKSAAAAPLLRDAIVRHALADRVIVASFDARITAPLRGLDFALGASTPEVAAVLARALLRRRGPSAGALGIAALCIPPVHNGIPLPIARMVRHVAHAGLVMHLWTINDPARALRYWRMGVQGIITDDPATMIAARRDL